MALFLKGAAFTQRITRKKRAEKAKRLQKLRPPHLVRVLAPAIRNHPANKKVKIEEILNKRFLKFWFPVILYSGMIFYASGLPNFQAPLEVPFLDKLAHLLEYALLGYLLTRALNQTTQIQGGQAFLWAVVFCLAYGVSDEFHQSFVSGRVACVSDGVADLIGGILGSWIYTR